MSFEVTRYKLGKKGLHCLCPELSSLLERNGNLHIMQYGGFTFLSDYNYDYGHRKWLALSKYNL